MIDLNARMNAVSEDVDAVSGWCSQKYDERFGAYFSEARKLFNELQSKRDKIPDSDLEWILMSLPVKLFDASERLAEIRVQYETIKLTTKRAENAAYNEARSSGIKQAEAKEYSAIRVAEDKLLMTAYSSIIDRVESEMSFCRELIMSAKKIWDARRKTELANPISEVSELPEYTPDQKKKSYVKGV